MLGSIAVTPVELLVLVTIFVAVRIVLSVRPVKAGSDGKSTAFAREYLDPFILAGLAAFLLITFVARTYYIPSGSMIPTLQIGDVLLVNKFEYHFHAPHDGDIVVFPPPIPSPDDFIKRVVARPGDTLRVAGGTVYVNGKALIEPYIKEPPDYNLIVKNYGVYVDNGAGLQPLDPSSANIPPKSAWTTSNRLPKDCFFMMGDNRNDSEDSHIWGFAQDTGRFATGPRAGEPAGFTGHAFVVFWPVHDAKILWR